MEALHAAGATWLGLLAHVRRRHASRALEQLCFAHHIMFGDLSAWAYEYAAGIVPVEPGFRKVAFRPHYLEGVDSFSATYQSPFGEISVSWCRVNGKPQLKYSVPNGVEVVK